MSVKLQGYAALTLSSMLLITACGSGSDDTAGSITEAVTGNEAEENTGEVPDVSQASATLETGRFVDSAVEGLSYSTATQSGRTDANGTFQYVAGESVIFSIGDVALPAVAGGEIITPLTVFNTDEIADPQVINLARLLQTLDEDGNADNGITITDDAIASGTGLTVDFAAANFDNVVSNLVANSGSVQSSLIDGESALDHFQETLFAEGLMEIPEMPTSEAPVAGENSATHDLVGTVREFTTRTHDVAGTVTILDDRTIEITNFIYDGDGPSVFFYTGTDGDFTSQGGGRIIGTQLNGNRFNGETVVLTLPDDVTLDDFNGLSVWCDIFNISFGDVFF